jgi:hypothetical protein
VQEPEEATYRSMPDSAIQGLNVQYIVRLVQMAPLLKRLAMSTENSPLQPKSTRFSQQNTTQTCPECGGVMTAARMGELVEYRCHVGHRFGLRTLIDQKAKNIERLLEAALAQSEELSSVLQIALDRPMAKNRTACRDNSSSGSGSSRFCDVYPGTWRIRSTRRLDTVHVGGSSKLPLFVITRNARNSVCCK